jgi:hypothetical protein
MAEKKVLVVGGGVAALAAAAALVEHNREKAERTGVRFDVTVMTSDDIWGGRASSWPGGVLRRREGHDPWDFRCWPAALPLNHGFHAVFDETTYVNFWHTLNLAGLPPEALKGQVLISNNHEILVHESETRHVCRLQVHDPARYPYPFNSHLTEAAWELLWRGGWSPGEILSFGLKIALEVLRYKSFDDLVEIDAHQQISFQKWCRDRGVRESVLNKMMFKFLFQGTYIAPNVMDASSALMGLWVIMRHMAAARWYYIDGGITEKLMDPIADRLKASGVRLLTGRELTGLASAAGFSTIEGYRSRDVTSNRESADHLGPFDYYISTLPLDSAVHVLKKSGVGYQEPDKGEPTLLEVFPDIAALEADPRIEDTAGTVNLQAWFERPGLLNDRDGDPRGDYRNVIAGLEPLCVMVDYQHILPIYRNNPRFRGSVLEINGSLEELESPEHYGYFECGTRFGDPDEPKTIEFAKAIMIDIAKRYKFPALRSAVEQNAFLEWPEPLGDECARANGGRNRIPPFLWKNDSLYNRFFVTGPGTLQYRPWIWRGDYEEHVHLRPRRYAGPAGYPRNLFLAGDWTRNGFDVPCMEGAARSGRMAALSIVKSALGRDPTADPLKREDTKGDPDFIQIYDPY